ncbi:MAG: FAD:protein FMN transferase [Butyrivibrio sp.]|nr:FAD:protein FMN transferase [Butyrivibrio sp.]
MDTIMELQAYGNDQVLADAEAMIRDIEKKVSVTDEGSEISALNSNGKAELSEITGDLLSRALEICRETEGALDISIYPVLKAWGFTTGEYQVPSEKELSSLLQSVDYRKVALDNGSATIEPGMQIDLGSVTKGYTSSRIADYFRRQGVTSALINLGGNVQCIGTKPGGENWKVAIKSPYKESKSGVFAVIETKDKAIITSGGYERYFEENGETYWHILDPGTGKPAKNGLISVTIIGEDGLMCDGLSTALFVKGLDGATDYWKNHEGFDAVFITMDGDVYITEGIESSFSLTSEYIDHKVTVLTR